MRRWWALVPVAAILVSAWFAAWQSSVAVKKLPGLTFKDQPVLVQPTRSSRPMPVGKQSPGSGGALLRLVFEGFLIVAGVVLLVIAGYLVRMLLRSLDRRKPRLLVLAGAGPAAAAQRGDEAEMLAAVDAGLAELSDTDADPRRAVIACWVRLEGAAAAAGTPREAGDSPTDLVARLLGAHQVSRPVLSGLARVYREARYTRHTIDQRMRQTAMDALRQLRGELASESVGHGT
jgi:hypothetical protein